VKKSFFIGLAAVLIFSFLLTGCHLSLITSRTNASVPGGKAGSGVLKLDGADPSTLDPAVSTEANSAQYILLIYSGLLKLDQKLEPVGDIAESWSVNDSSTVYTFKLRQNVKFQNGHSVTAADFKYSWERAAKPATGSQTAATYLGDILGVNEMLAGKANSIPGVVVKDDYTLQVTIDYPKSYFLYKLSYPTTFVVDQKVVSHGGEWWRTSKNGTGPFQLAQWISRQSLTLESNPLFYAEKPHLNSVQYNYYSGMPMDLYETGSIDVTGVSAAFIDAVTDQNGPFYKDLNISTDLSVSYVGFNCAQPPFDDPLVRKAFSQAIDKDKIIRLVYRSMEKKAEGLLPPGMPGYNPSLKGSDFDPKAAKADIQASRYGDASQLPPITFTVNGYGGDVGQLIQSIVYQWQENLGVNVKVRQLDTDRYFYNTRAEIDQMYLMSWIADYPHPQDFLDILFSSSTDYNYGGYSNPAVDKLIQQANLSKVETDRLLLYQKAEKMLVDDTACIPLTFGMNYYLVKYYVKNYTVNPLGFAQLQSVSVNR
jgi:oligopeptide transport system substrate-binding protein